MVKIEGIVAAMVTPFTEDGTQVAETALRSLVDRLIEEGADGLVPCGGTGEFAALSDGERRYVVEVVVDQVAGRVPVIAHTGAASTKEAVALSQHAEEAGAAAVMLVIPYFEPITLEEAFDYYAAVADAVGLPIVAYNHPGSTGLHMTTSFLVHLATEIESVKWVKDSSADLGQLFELAAQHPDDIVVLNGIDSLLAQALTLGVRGAIMGGVNFLAPTYAQMLRASREGDAARLTTLWRDLYPVVHFLDTNPYNAAIKAACEIIGHSAGPPRAPARPLSAERYDVLEGLLASLPPSEEH